MRRMAASGLAVALLWSSGWLATDLVGADSGAEKAATSLERVSNEVEFLASDKMEGRGPGTKGLDRAADYIRQEFKRLGLKSGVPDGSYYQPFELVIGQRAIPSATKLVLTGPNGQTKTLELGKDFQATTAGGPGAVGAELVFVGYGISAPAKKYDDYQGLDVAGKVVVMIRREPQQNDPSSVFDGKRNSAYSYIRTKLATAFKNKAAAVLLVNDPATVEREGKDQLAPASGFGRSPRKVPMMHVKQSVVDELLKTAPIKTADGKTLATLKEVADHIDTTLKPVSQRLAGWKADLAMKFKMEKTTVYNVVGILEGKGPQADQDIIVGAHYDHLGFGGFGSRRPGVYAVHNGADDNASGTSAMLELARRLASTGEPLGRRIVFIGFSAEERGLIGSRYYVEHPLFPLEKITAMINFDMIGNMRNNTLLVFGSGTAEGFDPLVDRAAEGTGLTLKKSAGVMAASDHWPFYQKKIPSLHLFSGMTQIYHTPDDDFETLNIEGIVKTIDYTENLIKEFAALPKQSAFTQKGRASMPGRRGPTARQGVPNYGFVPDYSARVNGVKVARVVAGKAAAKAGLKPGDVIVAVGGNTVSGFRPLILALRKADPAKPLAIQIERNGEKKTVQLPAIK